MGCGASARKKLDERQVLMLGLDHAGKTSVLFKLDRRQSCKTIPTIGMNIERITHGKFCLNIKDVGGSKAIRAMWKHYYHSAEGLIFVVDCGDPGRLDETQEELTAALGNEDLGRVSLLVYANKQDLPGALSAEELAKRLRLEELCQRPWCVQASCASTGEGLHAGLDWLCQALLAGPTQPVENRTRELPVNSTASAKAVSAAQGATTAAWTASPD
jgi:small GTP-binding protein